MSTNIPLGELARTLFGGYGLAWGPVTPSGPDRTRRRIAGRGAVGLMEIIQDDAGRVRRVEAAARPVEEGQQLLAYLLTCFTSIPPKDTPAELAAMVAELRGGHVADPAWPEVHRLRPECHIILWPGPGAGLILSIAPTGEVRHGEAPADPAQEPEAVQGVHV